MSCAGSLFCGDDLFYWAFSWPENSFLNLSLRGLLTIEFTIFFDCKLEQIKQWVHKCDLLIKKTLTYDLTIKQPKAFRLQTWIWKCGTIQILNYLRSSNKRPCEAGHLRGAGRRIRSSSSSSTPYILSKTNQTRPNPGHCKDFIGGPQVSGPPTRDWQSQVWHSLWQTLVQKGAPLEATGCQVYITPMSLSEVSSRRLIWMSLQYLVMKERNWRDCLHSDSVPRTSHSQLFSLSPHMAAELAPPQWEDGHGPSDVLLPLS